MQWVNKSSEKDMAIPCFGQVTLSPLAKKNKKTKKNNKKNNIILKFFGPERFCTNSETLAYGPIFFKLHVEPSVKGGLKICTNLVTVH